MGNVGLAGKRSPFLSVFCLLLSNIKCTFWWLQSYQLQGEIDGNMVEASGLEYSNDIIEDF